MLTMTMQLARSCHVIRQKSGMVDSVGPWVTMYALGCTRLCKRRVISGYSCLASLSTHVDIRGVDVVRVGNVGLGLQNNSIEII